MNEFIAPEGMKNWDPWLDRVYIQHQREQYLHLLFATTIHVQSKTKTAPRLWKELDRVGRGLFWTFGRN